MGDLNSIKSFVPQILKEVFVNNAAPLLHASVGQFIKEGGQSDPVGNSIDTMLRTNSGRLQRSLIKGQKENIFNFELNSSGGKLTYGTKVPYGQIHETGGTIHAIKRASSVSRRKEVFVMEQFFWYKYFSTGNKYYKNLAFHVGRTGSVNVPARPFMTPGIKLFQEKYLPLLITDFVSKIMQKIKEINVSK